MTDAELDPVIHAPVRLRITVTLSTLREGDYLSFSRLQQLLDLTPGNLITHLRKLEEAGYVASVKPAGDGQARTAVYLTHGGRAALERYTAALRQLLDQANPSGPAGAPASG
ncbi:MAG TPA: transcriptional regulator [Trebonia sp.]|jgi:DNA-binding MarR family transcriptional regulator